jgi:hypothetical protein
MNGLFNHVDVFLQSLVALYLPIGDRFTFPIADYPHLGHIRGRYLFCSTLFQCTVSMVNLRT